MLRWLAVPASFATLGLSAAIFLYWVFTPGEGTQPSRHWTVLLLLAFGATVAALLTTLAWRARDSGESRRISDHFRHMLLVYPLWLASTAAFAGSHVSHFFLYPFAALSGIIIGNLIALVRSGA